MNQAKALQLITALIVIAVALMSAILVGADPASLAILVVTGLLLIFVMWHRTGDVVARPPLHLHPDPPNITELPAFRLIMEGLADPALIVQRGKVAMANAEAIRLLGTHIVGEDVRIAIRHPAAAERLTGVEMVQNPVKIDIVGLGTRTHRWAMRIIPIDKEQGQERLFVHLSDESDAYAVERVRGDFVANASHELRTPLAAILGFVETLQDPKAGADSETRDRFLTILEKEARRMQQLVDDLMSLSRIEADKYRLPTSLIAVSDLIDEVVDLSRQNLGPRGSDITVEIARGTGPIQGDRTQIAQLLHNLISNSAKYGRPDTPITVHVGETEPAMVRLEISDEGEGIAADHLPRLTERFYRVDSGRSRALGGTGLGLAIVKHIVERHRGRLDITSIPGRGTKVTVLLPRADAEQIPIEE